MDFSPQVWSVGGRRPGIKANTGHVRVCVMADEAAGQCGEFDDPPNRHLVMSETTVIARSGEAVASKTCLC